jgi:acetyl esterase/lipase
LKFSHSHTEGINATATLLLAGLEKTMQLDTHVRNLLDMFANSGQPKIWELAPAEARNMALALTQMVEGKEPIGKIENGSLPGPEGALPFRMFTPASAGAEPLACIVYFHGGAWIFGNLRYTRLRVQDARQREWLPCHFGGLSTCAGTQVSRQRGRRLCRHQMGCR